jgi:anti-anti-sigma factor
MAIEIRKAGAINILEFSGKLSVAVVPNNVKEMEVAIDKLIESAEKYVVLDLRLVRFMDSSAIGEIVHSSKKLQGEKGRLAVSRIAGGEPDQIMQTCGIDRVIDMYDDVESAIASWADRTPPE